MTQTLSLEMEAMIDTLRSSFEIFKNNNSTKSWFGVGREKLGDWFNARGIYEKFGVDYRVFLKNFFNTDAQENEMFILNLFSEAKVTSFYNAISNKSDEITVPQAPAQAAQVETAKVESVERKRERTSANLSLMLPIQEIVDESVKDYIENESGLIARVEERIEAAARKLLPNMIQIGDAKPVKITGKLHSAFTKSLQLTILERQIFIAGEAGTGKTTLAAQIAKALELPFGHISCTAGMSEAHLLGRMDAHGNYLMSQFVNMYENGGVFLFDEIDAADSNTMLIINSALANGHMSVPNRKENPVATRNEKFFCVCAANTWGFGSNEYAGRNILDAAFLDRFAASRLVVSYDMELEKEISNEFPEVCEAIWKIRENVKANRIRRVVSTRAIVSGVRQRTAGISLNEFLDTFFTGWTPEEVSKAKAGI
jgi:cobaltochelatase CobS